MALVAAIIVFLTVLVYSGTVLKLERKQPLVNAGWAAIAAAVVVEMIKLFWSSILNHPVIVFVVVLMIVAILATLVFPREDVTKKGNGDKSSD